MNRQERRQSRAQADRVAIDLADDRLLAIQHGVDDLLALIRDRVEHCCIVDTGFQEHEVLASAIV